MINSIFKTRRTILSVVIVYLTLTACGLFSPQGGSSRGPNIFLVGPSSNSTPTPFMPISPTSTSNAPLFPTATGQPGTGQRKLSLDRPGGTVWNIPAGGLQGNIPQPAPLFNQPQDQINILVLGSDQRPFTGGFRTDVLILVTVNFKDKSINMTSFPRDLYVYIPGHFMGRINTAHARGGSKLSADTFEYNFGVRPDYYALVRFDGFVSFIDTLGGIYVDVGQALTDHRTGRGTVTIFPGNVYMDSETALWYVRSRYTTSDFDRGRRQQEVIIAMFNRLMSFDMIVKGPQLYNDFQYAIETDLELDEYIKLLSFSPQFADGNFNRFAVGPGQVTPWTEPFTGAALLLPDRGAIRSVLENALNIK